MNKAPLYTDIVLTKIASALGFNSLVIYYLTSKNEHWLLIRRALSLLTKSIEERVIVTLSVRHFKGNLTYFTLSYMYLATI